MASPASVPSRKEVAAMPGLRRCALGLFVLLTVLWLPAVVLAQGAKAGVVTTLEGNVTAARAALPQPVGLRFKDDVFVNDRIVAGDRSLARLLLGGKAVVTVRERSSLTITEVPGRSTIELSSGKIAVAVAREKMRAGESIEVRTPNAVAAVRGTVFVTEVTQATAALEAAQPAVTTNIYGFADQVVVTMAGQLFTVGPKMFLTGTGFQPPTVGTMTADVRARALAGLQARAQQVGAGQDGAKDQAVGTTVATFSAGPPPEVVAPPAAPENVTPPTPQQNQAPILPGGDQALGGGQQTPSGGGGGFKPAGTPTGVLVFGDRGPGSTLSADLAGFGHTVTMNVTTLPVDLTSFGTIWHVSAFTALTAAEQTRLADFLALGRGLHLTGEHPLCCGTLNASLQTLVRSVVAGGSAILVGGLSVIDGPYDFNASASGGITTTPNALTTWNPSAPGGISGISGANVLVTGAGGVAVGAVWNSGDLVGGSGRLTLLMDSDWIFGSGGLERLPVIKDIQTYIDDPPTTLSLSGPLFRSTSEQLETASDFLQIVGYTVAGSGGDPLLWLGGSTVTTAGDFVRMTDSAVSGDGPFVRLEDGAEIIQTGFAEPLVSMRRGSLSMDGPLFDLAGRASATAVDPETGLTLGTDRPLQPGSESPVFRADDGATVSVRSAYRVDTALLEATAPLLALAGGSTLVTGSHAVDLIGRAKVSIPNDAVAMISLNASALTVLNGNLVNVAGGSVLNVAGSLVSLANGSTLSVLNGLLLNVSGGSVANIGKSLVSFSGSGNVLSVTNSFAPTALVGGIPVYGPTDSFKITAPSAIAGLGTAGTVKINGVTLTPTTSLGSLSGSLVAVQSGGRVKIGP